MTSSSEGPVSMDTFKTMIGLAGLGMSDQEIEDLKPLYDLYALNVSVVHAQEFGAEEISAAFHPDWPDQ